MFQETLYKLHIYDNKVEAFVKSILIFISWLGSIYLTEKTDIIDGQNSIAFYVFSISLIMEYVFKFLTSKGNIEKIFPASICIINLIVLFCSITGLFGKPYNSVTCGTLGRMTLFSQVILWIDTALMIFADSPMGKKVKIFGGNDDVD